MSNLIPPSKSLFVNSVEAALRAGGLKLREVPVSHLAAIHQNGAEVDAPRAPRELIFVPTGSHGLRADTPDFRVALGNIPAGTVIYRLEAVSDDGRRSEVGEIELLTPFVASSFGDKGLFFQHATP